MANMDDLVAQYRDIYHGTRKPLIKRCNDLLANGASQEFVARIYERDLGKALQCAGWTREMFECFSTVDMLQRLHRVAIRSPDRLQVQVGDEVLTARSENGLDGSRFVFDAPDGTAVEVQGSVFPELRCPVRSEDREGLDPLTENQGSSQQMRI